MDKGLTCKEHRDEGCLALEKYWAKLVSDFKDVKKKILKTLVVEAFCCTKSRQFSTQDSDYVYSILTDLEQKVSKLEEDKTFKRLDKLYERVDKLEEKLDVYAAEISKRVVDNIADFLMGKCEEEYENGNDRRYKFYSNFFMPKGYLEDIVETEATEKLEALKEETEEFSSGSSRTWSSSNCKIYKKYRNLKQKYAEVDEELQEKEEKIKEIYHTICKRKEKCEFCRKNFNINIDESKYLLKDFADFSLQVA